MEKNRENYKQKKSFMKRVLDWWLILFLPITAATDVVIMGYSSALSSRIFLGAALSLLWSFILVVFLTFASNIFYPSESEKKVSKESGTNQGVPRFAIDIVDYLLRILRQSTIYLTISKIIQNYGDLSLMIGFFIMGVVIFSLITMQLNDSRKNRDRQADRGDKEILSKNK